MEFLNAKEIKKWDQWCCLIYSEPGKGKTTMVRSLEGKTIVLSIDGMYSVLSGLDDVVIVTIDPKDPNTELESFIKKMWVSLDKFDNIVIDNLSTFQKTWLNSMGNKTKSGMPELRDYGVVDRILFELVNELKGMGKNVLLFAHEKKVEIVREGGGVYTQSQPDIRNLDAIMGIIPLVGRLVIHTDSKTQEKERIIVLQPTQSTRAKDQLIGDLQTIGQMELLPKLKGENK